MYSNKKGTFWYEYDKMVRELDYLRKENSALHSRLSKAEALISHYEQDRKGDVEEVGKEINRFLILLESLGIKVERRKMTDSMYETVYIGPFNKLL